MTADPPDAGQPAPDRPDAGRPDQPVGWLPTAALAGTVASTAVLLGFAVLLGRQDLLVLALPLAVAVLLPLLTRPADAPTVRVATGAGNLFEGQVTSYSQVLEVADAVDVVRLRSYAEGPVEPAEGSQDFCTTAAPRSRVVLEHELGAPRWGRSRIGRVSMTVTAAHGLLRCTRTFPEMLPLVTFPLRAEFSATDVVPSALGIVGGHRSRRTGEGVDPAGVRPFVAGDRLRRIHWPVSQRTGQLHVTTTYSDRDTEVVLVLDSAVEVGVSAGPDAASNLDVSVRAAAAIAEHYLRNGDRVGVLDLGRVGRPVRLRAGQAHLFRILEALLDVRTAQVGEPAVGRAMSRIPSRALVILLSPLLSDAAAAQAAGLSRAGRTVLVVDTLPAEVVWPEPGPWLELAWRLRLIERDNLAAALADSGVPVVPWLGSRSLDQVLVGLSRTTRVARVHR